MLVIACIMIGLQISWSIHISKIFQGMVRLSSPYLEIKEVTLTHSFYTLHMEKIWNERKIVERMGHFRYRSMVMSGLHNSQKIHNLIFSCFHDPYNEKIAKWMEDSYINNVQGNGKVMPSLFLNDDDKGKYDVVFHISIYYHSCY
jgi:hypothetical protein